MKGWTVALLCLTAGRVRECAPLFRARGPVQRSAVPGALRAHQRRRRVRAQPGDEGVPRRRHRAAPARPGHPAGPRRRPHDSRAAPARVRVDDDAQRGAGVRARSGNCLSLVIMTAALAKGLELPVRFQSVTADETLGRSGDIQFIIGHVNVTLGDRTAELGSHRSDSLTVDFVPHAGRGAREHAADRRGDDRRNVHEQPRGGGAGGGAARRRLLVGARGDRAGPEIPERLQHARRRLPAARRPGGRGAGVCAYPRARPAEHARDVEPRAGARGHWAGGPKPRRSPAGWSSWTRTRRSATSCWE